MKHVSNNSATTSKGNEKWLLLLVVIVGLGGLLLTFNSTTKEQRLDIEGIQLEGRMVAPSASAEVQKDYVLR